MSDSASATQVAFIARLRGDATLQGLMSGASAPEWNIFGKMGGGQTVDTFPSVYVWPITTLFPGTTLAAGSDANDVLMQVDVFTSFEGFDQAEDIDDRIYDLFHMPGGAAALSLTGFTNTWTQALNKHELEEVSDQPIQHIARQFQCWNHI